MVGCMLATSLAMAPATLLAQGAAIVDLDGPLLLERDRRAGTQIRAAAWSFRRRVSYGVDRTRIDEDSFDRGRMVRRNENEPNRLCKW